MRTMIVYLLVACAAIFGGPGLSWAQAPAQTAAAPAPASPEEQAQLAQLGSQDASLLQQSAGERVVVVERGPRWRGPGYGYGPGAFVLTVVLLTLLIVVAAQPTYYRR
jgi:hypothetical protein